MIGMPASTEPGDGRRERSTAFDLHRLDARFLQEAAAVAEELGEAVVRESEGEVADHERLGLGADDGRGVMGSSCPR
jgi:hypothetical protein